MLWRLWWLVECWDPEGCVDELRIVTYLTVVASEAASGAVMDHCQELCLIVQLHMCSHPQ